MSNELKNKQNADEMPNVSNQQLQQQLEHLQGNIDEIQGKFAHVEKRLDETFVKAQDAKHTVEGYGTHFISLTKLFEKQSERQTEETKEQNVKLNQIHESLLVGQYQSRITKLEAQMELKATEVLATKNDLVLANTLLKNEFNAVSTRISSLDAQLQQKEIQISANVKELDSIKGWKSNMEGRLVIIGIIWPIVIGVISFILSHYYK